MSTKDDDIPNTNKNENEETKGVSVNSVNLAIDIPVNENCTNTDIEPKHLSSAISANTSPIIDRKSSIKATSNNNEEEQVKFPFFVEKREPFFWFNNVCFVICFAAFLYFTVNIIQDFIKQRRSPPTATNLLNQVDQKFPGMVFCNHFIGFEQFTPMTPLFAFFFNGIDVLNVTNKVQKLACPSAPPSSSNAKQAHCWYLDIGLPAFNYSTVGDTKQCNNRNNLLVGFDINAANYSEEVFLSGIDGYFFEAEKHDTIIDKFCKNLFPTNCLSLVAPTDACSSEITTDYSLDSFFATTQIANLISLERSQIQTSPRCGEELVQWNPKTTVSNYNPKFLQAQNVTILNIESSVMMQIDFRTYHVSRTTYNPQSGQSMFGSLSGWFGFLSDGWGILSVLFIFEEFINYVRAVFA